jgi:lipoyl(octanoyl) transferase
VKEKKGLIGIWVSGEYKIASIGLRLRRWVTYYGLSININPNLDNFRGIVPCGNAGFGVTSLEQQGVSTSVSYFDEVLKDRFVSIFEEDKKNW